MLPASSDTWDDFMGSGGRATRDLNADTTHGGVSIVALTMALNILENSNYTATISTVLS